MKLTKIFISMMTLCISTITYAQSNDTEIEHEVFAGLSMNNFTGDDAEGNSMKMGFHVGFTFRTYLVGNGFVEGSFGIATKGYKSESFSTSGSSWNYEGTNYDAYNSEKYTSYNLELPILVGYRFVLGNEFNLKVKVGPYLTYAFAGKSKSEGYIITYPDIRSSEKEYINSETMISDMEGFKHFGCGIHASISADYRRFIISASYQRAFTKVFDDAKAYEQNILISLGYRL